MKFKGIIRELRLDNYIICDQHYGVIKVDAIHRKKIGFHRNPGRLEWVYASNIHPIPITTDFLFRNFEFFSTHMYLQMGQETIDKSLYVLSVYKLPNTDRRLALYMDGSVTIEGNGLRLHSVHQLQNALADNGIDVELKFEKLTVNEEKTE